VAEYLEAHPKTEVNPYELGRHFQLGGALPRAEVYLWNSVQQAMRVGLHADSVHQLHAWMRAYTGDPEVFWERVLGYLKDHFSASTLLFGEVCRYLVEKARLYGNPDLLAMMISYRIRATPEPEWGERHALLQEAYKCLPSCTSLLPRIHVLRAHRSVEETEGCRNVDALHNETIRVAQEFGDDEEILESLLEFAVELTTRSRYQESHALLDAAEVLVKSKSVSKRLEIDYMLARATLAGDLGNRALAIELYLKALEHLRLFGADRQLCVVQWNVANQYFLAKRYTEALAMLREAETVSGYMPFYDMRGMVAMSLAELQAHMGEIEGARGLYLRARDVFNHPANDHLRLVTFFDALYATFLRRQGLLDEAEVYLPEPSDDHYLNAKIWAERGFLRLAQGLDAKEAIRACAQSVEAAGFSPLSEPWMLRDALLRAADAPADALWFGECVADLPPALHAALVARQA
jgi:tetratricopeptide (TPR) repeat protein